MAKITGLAAKIAANKYRKTLQDKGYVFFDRGDYNLNIIGVRNNSGDASKFDDFINLFYKVDGNWVWDVYPATTEPGTRLLKFPLASVRHKGAAILVCGQYRSVYEVGTHGGKRKYTALVQRGGPVEVWRDNNRDATPDTGGKKESGMFGINLHRHWGPDEREYTGGVSAGCQVFQSSLDFYEFMDTCNHSADKYGNSFTYTLIMESDVEGESPEIC